MILLHATSHNSLPFLEYRLDKNMSRSLIQLEGNLAAASRSVICTLLKATVPSRCKQKVSQSQSVAKRISLVAYAISYFYQNETNQINRGSKEHSRRFPDAKSSGPLNYFDVGPLTPTIFWGRLFFFKCSHVTNKPGSSHV